MLLNSPCKGCTKRDGLNCKDTCSAWASFERQKEDTYAERKKNGSMRNVAVGAKTKSGDERKRRLNLW